jgi:hypothetical protein
LLEISIAIPSPRRNLSVFFEFFLFFDRHVLEFAGLEYISTFLTFDILGLFVAGDDSYSRVLALLGIEFTLWRW